MSRRLVKRFAEAVLVRSGATAVARFASRTDRLVLSYHNVAPDGAAPQGDRSLHLPLRRFAEHLDRLLRTHDVLPLDRILDEGAAAGRRPRVAITFDDAYRGASLLGVEELVRRSLPATIFVCPGRLGDRSFWWDAVAEPDGSPLAPALRTFLLEELEGRAERVLPWARENGLRELPVPEHARTVTEAELERVARQPGITLGAHSWSHPNLARLAPPRLKEELESSWTWLRERYASAIPWLSYPYGRFSAEVAAAARAAGFAGALRVEGGWLGSATPDRYALPRINVPADLSAHGFSIYCSGIRGR